VGRDGPHWTAGDLDDDQDDARTPRRSRLLLVLATVPWLVVVWVVGSPATSPAPDTGEAAAPSSSPSAGVAADDEGWDEQPSAATGEQPSAATGEPPGAATGEPPGAATGAATGEPPGGPADQPQDETSEGPAPPAAAGEPAEPADAAGPVDDPGHDLVLLEQRGRWRVEAGAEEAAALAVVVARAWLTDHEPRLAIADLATPEVGRYAEHLVVEAVEATAPELTVVTLLAVLLDGQDELTATVRRVAVPIAVDARGAQPAGAPWWLPSPDLTPAAPPVRPIEDAAELLTAVGALEAAGYEQVQLDRLEDLGGTAAIATVTARTPDGERVDGPVVLRRHVDRYVVAGDVLARAEPVP
jgi:hypothetical protein